MNVNRFLKFTGLFSHFLSYIGCIALSLMMCLTVIDVIGRYVFNSPILGAFEITQFLILVLVFSFLGYTQAQKSHVTVDLFFNRLSRRNRTFVSIFNYAAALFIFFIIARMGFERAVESFHNAEKPMNIAIPNYPFIFFLSYGTAIVCIEFLRDIVEKFDGTNRNK